jgi:hypothetical protein
MLQIRRHSLAIGMHRPQRQSVAVQGLIDPDDHQTLRLGEEQVLVEPAERLARMTDLNFEDP